MQILLTVPTYANPFRMDLIEGAIYGISERHDIDLIVFPEGYESFQTTDELLEVVEKISRNYQAAVLMGATILQDNSEWAAYVNANAMGDETKTKLYCKHSTAPTTAFQLEDYEDWQEEFYKPVYYKGKTLQFSICHDIYLPLLTEKLLETPCDYFINLTGGNVKMSKWHNIFKARSLESNTVYLCTMGNDPGRKQPSYPFAYMYGEDIAETASFTTDEDENASRYALFDFTDELALKAYEPSVQMVSDKQYTDFTIGFDTAKVDVNIDTKELKLMSEFKVPSNNERVIEVLKSEHSVKLYRLNYEQLYDRRKLYTFDMPEQSHHIAVYMTDEQIDVDAALAVAKLRTIENRVGVVVVAANAQFAVRTNRYKDIQLFHPVDGVIGFSFEFMHGYHSTFNKTNDFRYVGTNHKEAYLALTKNPSLIEKFFY